MPVLHQRRTCGLRCVKRSFPGGTAAYRSSVRVPMVSGTVAHHSNVDCLRHDLTGCRSQSL